MMELTTNWWLFPSIAAAVSIGGALAPLLRTFLERLIGFQFERRMEEFRDEVRVRDQSAKTAEYLSMAFRLDADEDKQVYHRVNQLGWGLALYLPPDVYRKVRDAVAAPDMDNNVTTALIAVREHLLSKDAGNLIADDIAIHAPNARSIKK